MALKQVTKQSSTLDPWVSENAVDGQLSPEDNIEGQSTTCTHTKFESNSHTWTLTLSSDVSLLRIDIYNRVNKKTLCCKDRLRGFTLNAYKDNDVVFSYTDKTPEAQEVYHVTPQKKLSIAVNGILITSREDAEALTLCEVHVLGGQA
ncbi:fucolectin-related protein [Elysia marginata]|uniref:Fucolectin-related protein n=1 Tax=Elysia marginata TaxID=1093978 RepID=A0AAV4GJW4_9GAST|nr:fucolectin-related protein [Elysia marginata]